MKRISARLLIALLTFAAGLGAFAAWHFLRPQHSHSSVSQQAIHLTAPPSTVEQEPRFSGRYENPTLPGGLFYVVRSSDGYIIDSHERDERVLVLSYDGKPIEHRSDEVGTPALPGLYLSKNLRIEFERVELIGKKVYFKTRRVGSMSYEFSGTSGEEIIPGYAPPTRAPIIKGILSRLSDGKVVGEEEIKFRHTDAT